MTLTQRDGRNDRQTEGLTEPKKRGVGVGGRESRGESLTIKTHWG